MVPTYLCLCSHLGSGQGDAFWASRAVFRLEELSGHHPAPGEGHRDRARAIMLCGEADNALEADDEKKNKKMTLSW